MWTAADEEWFMGLVARELPAHGLALRMVHDRYFLTPPGAPVEREWFPENLRRSCATQPLPRWSELIRAHFESTDGLWSKIDALGADWPRARAALRVRLMSGMPDEIAATLVTRPFATDLRQVLVYDHTQWSASVPRDHLSGWRVTEDELFALGMAHLRSQSIRLMPLQIPIAPRLVGWVEKNLLIADHFLRLRELGKWPRLGALVAVPTRGALLVQPIYGRAIYDEGRMLVTLAIMLHSRDPWPLSPRLYWWREGRIRDVNIGVEGGRLQLIFPERLY